MIARSAMIERRPFGRTGHPSTVTFFGGAALARASQADADRTLDLLLQYGVNHIDTAAQSSASGRGWPVTGRTSFSKTGSRTASEAREDLYRSLELAAMLDSTRMTSLFGLATRGIARRGFPPRAEPHWSTCLRQHGRGQGGPAHALPD